jgi:hypothetical protein
LQGEVKRVAILQSNYIPWKGYFDLINSVDLFVFHDDIQYTKNDWRNRNKIKTPEGVRWITIPTGTNEKRLIYQVELSDFSWQRKHWNLIRNSYAKAPYWNNYKDFFEDFYLSNKWTNLSQLNQHLIRKISVDFLGISNVEFQDSRKYNLKEKKESRVLELLKKVNATEYISGPAAKSYICKKNFEESNIQLTWFDYSDYKQYEQLGDGFVNDVSIIDLLFNCGPNALLYMRRFK